MSILITGVAGFIGSNLAMNFLRQGFNVVGFDNYCRGSEGNIKDLLEMKSFTFANVDLNDLNAFRRAVIDIHSCDRISEVWHMAANSDIPAGIYDARIDLRDTFMTTFNTLELMKEFKIDNLYFASSSAIYGDAGEQILSEDFGPLFPISNYGAMKLASEALISASCESFIKRASIFRFPNVVGIPATHGVILDFIRKIQMSKGALDVLGDGTQRKCYLHLDDLIDAMFFIRQHASEKLNFFNIGAGDSGITVREIAELVVENVAPDARIKYGVGGKGWSGDVPKFSYSVDKINALGWEAKMDSVEAVSYAIKQIAIQECCVL